MHPQGMLWPCHLDPAAAACFPACLTRGHCSFCELSLVECPGPQALGWGGCSEPGRLCAPALLCSQPAGVRGPCSWPTAATGVRFPPHALPHPGMQRRKTSPKSLAGPVSWHLAVLLFPGLLFYILHWDPDLLASQKLLTVFALFPQVHQTLSHLTLEGGSQQPLLVYCLARNHDGNGFGL